LKTKKTEDLAVMKVKEVLYKSSILVPYIEVDDKKPSWDGSILVYKSKKLTKDSILGKIDVQVKGTNQNKHKYPVNISDLKNYYNSGGAIFFVVNVKNYNIYYKLLLPYDIKQYLNKVKTNQKTISIDFKKLDISNVENMENICKGFLVDSRMQQSTTSVERKIEEFNKLIFNSPTFSEDYLLENPAYLYGLEHEKSVPIPVAKINLEQIESNKSRSKNWHRNLL